MTVTPESIEPHPVGARAARADAGPDRILDVGIAIAVLTVTWLAVAHVVGVGFLDDRFLHLNADDEQATPAWLGSAATFAAALGALLLALLPAVVDRALVALAVILAFFSLDDAVAIHERVAEKAASVLGVGDVAERLIWPALFLPVFALALVVLVRTARALERRARRLVEVGIALLALAVATELVTAFLYEVFDVERGSWPDSAAVVVEEGAELGAWILIAAAFLATVLAAVAEERGGSRRSLQT